MQSLSVSLVGLVGWACKAFPLALLALLAGHHSLHSLHSQHSQHSLMSVCRAGLRYHLKVGWLLFSGFLMCVFETISKMFIFVEYEHDISIFGGRKTSAAG